MQDVVERRIAATIHQLLAEEPVIALHGPRAVGKTTLLRQLAATAGVEVVDLDDLATRDAARADPALFVSGPAPVCIDEYQHVPELLDAIKAELNTDSRPGRFLLTGSTRHDALPVAAQALTGRLHLVDVLPLSRGEITRHTETFTTRLLTDPTTLITATPSTTDRDTYARLVCTGGFPMAIDRNETARNRWFDSYLRLTLERDLDQLTSLRRRDRLPVVLARLASQTAQVLNLSSVARDTDLDPDTIGQWTTLLEAVFLVHRLPAWGTTLSSRATSTPKLHVVDAGLAARLLRLTPARLAARDATALQQFGHLLETFVVGEIRKQLSWTGQPTQLGHWRTSDGIEVDLVIETDHGTITAIETKAARRIRDTDLHGLRQLRDKLGTRFTAGIALYTGNRSYTVDDRIHVLPIDHLWT